MYKMVRTTPTASAFGLASLIAVTAMTACGKDNPNQPTTGSATVTVPKAVSPLDGTVIPNSKQPVTLVVRNALTTGGGVTYTFEVASDAGFTNKVQTKEEIGRAHV